MWKYKVKKKCLREGEERGFEEFLNEHGKNGWELVDVSWREPSSFYKAFATCTFKKFEKKDE